MINPATGKQDGINYTFGKSKVCIALASRLQEHAPHKFGAVHAVLSKYSQGLHSLNSLPNTDPMKQVFLDMWRRKFREDYDQLLTDKEGRTFLINLLKAKYNNVIGGVK